MQKYFLIILSIYLTFTTGCASSEYLIFDCNKEHTVNFYLSNQNRFSSKPVHFIVTLEYSCCENYSKIDVFDEEMDFGTGIMAGHNTKGNELILKEGSYVLSVSTNSNDLKLDVRFEIAKNQWIYIGYNEDNQFEIGLSSTPIIFG